MHVGLDDGAARRSTQSVGQAYVSRSSQVSAFSQLARQSARQGQSVGAVSTSVSALETARLGQSVSASETASQRVRYSQSASVSAPVTVSQRVRDVSQRSRNVSQRSQRQSARVRRNSQRVVGQSSTRGRLTVRQRVGQRVSQCRHVSAVSSRPVSAVSWVSVHQLQVGRHPHQFAGCSGSRGLPGRYSQS